MEFMYFVFTRIPGESYFRRLWSLLLCLCDVFRAQSTQVADIYIFFVLFFVMPIQFVYLTSIVPVRLELPDFVIVVQLCVYVAHIIMRLRLA